MFASTTRGFWRWIAIATTTLVFVEPALAQDSQQAEERSQDNTAPSHTALSSTARVDAETGAAMVQLPPTAMVGTPSVRAHQIELTAGTIHVEVDGPEAPSLNVQIVGDKLVEMPSENRIGPVLIRGPRGQVAIVEQGRATVRLVDGQFHVINRRGKTLVGDGRSITALAAGFARVEGCDGPGIRPVIAAPTFRAGGRMFVAVDGEIRPSRLAWTGSSEASRYQLRVEDVDRGAPPVTVMVDGTELGEAAPALAPGNYKVTVQSVDACGIEGERSSAEALRVVGLGLPNGAYQDDDGTIRMEVGAHIRLTHTQGISLSHHNATGWIPVPRELSLRRNAEQEVLLRVPGAEPTQIRLAPRNLRASVKLGPRNVQWPGPGIAVTVQLQTADGRQLPDWLEPLATVTVDMARVPMKWDRDGDTLRGVIPPQAGELPCVVRVEVTDQFGLPLGRNFMEVARSSS